MDAEIERLEGAGNVLVLAPAVDESVDVACKQLLTPASPEHLHILVLSFALSPEEWVADWRERVGALPADLTIVTTSEGLAPTSTVTDAVTVETISSPGDLTGLGMLISKYLERWHTVEHLLVCFDSLTALLQYDDPQNVYRFLQVVTTRLTSVDASAHFHLDPATQDEQVVSIIKSAFGAVLEHEHADDDWVIHAR